MGFSRRQRITRRQAGLTLAELLVTLAVVAILLGVAIPSYQGLVERRQADGANSGMVNAVNMARSEAMKRGGGVMIAPLDDADADNEWGAGWHVFVDENGDGDFDDGTDEVIQQFDGVPDGMTMDGPDGADAIAFSSRGFPSAPIAIELCDEGRGVRVSMSAVGRVESEHMEEAECPAP